MAEVDKYGGVVPMSEQLLADMIVPTPEQMEENRQRRKAERVAEREARAVPFTADAVEDRMGWKRGYLAHLAQPYCHCGDTCDGWEYCDHAYDLGLVPWQEDHR